MPTGANDPARLLNRELSWLDFNSRVLALAEDPSIPPLERAKFLAIFASNLDEFYMVRVAGIKRQVAAGLATRSPDGLLPREQLAAIAEKTLPAVQRHGRAFCESVLPVLRESGVEVIRWRELDEVQQKELNELFQDQIFPVVTPLAVDQGHPFPYISNRSLNLAVLVRDPVSAKVHFARIKVPPLLPRFIALSGEEQFVPLEDVIAANLDKLFSGMEVLEHHTFRVTRNADLEVNDDDAEDLMRLLEEELQRKRFSPAVRLEIEPGMPDRIRDLLMTELQIESNDVQALPAPLGLSGLWDLYNLDRPDLKYEPFQPVTPSPLVHSEEAGDVFSALKEGDILLHHPYDSFTTTVERFIEQAAEDPDVLAIKQTLYRTSGDSPIVDALIEAAEAGKQVVVLVEIKARFDERNNINWARALERAGCHVVYGLMGLKTHSKLCLVVRQEGKRLRRYVHVGTGNYNPKTARIYEDLGLLTSDTRIGSAVSDLFNYLTGYSRQTKYRSLIVAPHGLRKRLLSLIRHEANVSTSRKPGHIAMKLNALVDAEIIEALYDASQAGVRVDLAVRGICSLRPGVKGLSETIRVRSILGRFLEHSRILYFRNEDHPKFYIGSADLMPRNLDRRVEALVAITEPESQSRLQEILELCMSANAHAWALGPEGEWAPVEEERGAASVDMQEELMRRALNRE
jgi:polyphosphate kinase